jgi:hypothetical protein
MDINWQGFITVTLTAFVIAYFTTKARFEAKKGQLQYGLFMKGLGLVSLLIAVVPFLILITGSYQVDRSGETTALIGIVIGFGIGAIYTLGEGFLVKGRYDKESISFTTPWTGKKHEKWDDLESIKFNAKCYWYVLKFKRGKVIRLSLLLGGYGYLIEYLEKRGLH